MGDVGDDDYDSFDLFPMSGTLLSAAEDTTALRNLPIGLRSGVTITTRQDIYPYAFAALGPVDAPALIAMLSSSSEA